jgi:ankyrin repeat protein
LSSAVGYGQWAAARQLLARGAKTQLWHEAALGLVDAIQGRLDADPALRGDALSGPLWNSCHGGQLAAAQLLLKHGADLSWSAPWSGQTSLDIAEAKSHAKVVAWLRKQGAVSGKQEG